VKICIFFVIFEALTALSKKFTIVWDKITWGRNFLTFRSNILSPSSVAKFNANKQEAGSKQEFSSQEGVFVS
jgi:hypothetical protein